MGAQPSKDTAATVQQSPRGSTASLINNVLTQSSLSLRDNLCAKGSRSPSLKAKFPAGSNIFTEHNADALGKFCPANRRVQSLVDAKTGSRIGNFSLVVVNVDDRLVILGRLNFR
ncbi:hypothetical protein BV898_05323 [Hypsibius exemplaris]|uniref:Uncharacterized protein n=1 Tax=Hypsibius exemplaris TaxID=2072580 RepID=A0A1W0WZW1_HYPEX|nr:hypothetical protein BV898_05323 [Hypsibius exemplaris]